MRGCPALPGVWSAAKFHLTIAGASAVGTDDEVSTDIAGVSPSEASLPLREKLMVMLTVSVGTEFISARNRKGGGKSEGS